MKLLDLQPAFIRYVGDSLMHVGDPPDVALADADAIMFLCPKCFAANGGPVRTHQVICNRPRVEQSPKRVGPGRWEFDGTGFNDLTLISVPGKSDSIQLEGGCRAHFWVKNGMITT